MSSILTTSVGVLVSILAIAFLVYMAARGWHNGIVHSLVGILVFVAAIMVANTVANKYSPQFTRALEPMLTGIINDASQKAIGQKARTTRDENGQKVELPIEVPKEYDGTVKSACLLSFKEIGFDTELQNRFADEISKNCTEVNSAMRDQITSRTAAVVSYVLVFTLVCVLLLVAGAAIMNLFNLIIHFPGYELVSQIMGAGVSLLLGFLVLYALCWLLRFCGAVVPERFMSDSSVLAFFFRDNPLIKLTLY